MKDGKPIADSAEEQKALSSASPAEEEAMDTAAVTDAATQLTAVTAERDRLLAEKNELYDRLLRRQADFENFRRRVERERADIFEYAGMETVGALLPILDDFERAIKAAEATEGPEREYIKGIEIIYQRFVETLRKLGLEPIEAVGQPFDPNLHHAVETVDSEEYEDHTILDEWQRGYNYKGRLLRPAMVRVAVKPPGDSDSVSDS
jgi:molecular chaperone GrpE